LAVTTADSPEEVRVNVIVSVPDDDVSTCSVTPAKLDERACPSVNVTLPSAPLHADAACLKFFFEG